MSVLTPDQIARYALGAGFGITDGITATAIAIAESGGDPKANYVTSKEDSRGLWQINVKAHPEYASQNLYDPGTNAKAAFAVYKSSGWHAWTTYGGPAYLAALAPATAGMAAGKALGPLVDPIDSVVGGVVGGAAQAAGGALSGVDALGAFVQDIESPQTWLRVVKVVGGAVLVGLGVALVLRPIVEPVAKQTAQTAAKVAAVVPK